MAIHGKNFCNIVVDLYCWLTRSWFAWKDLQLSEKPWKRPKFSSTDVCLLWYRMQNSMVWFLDMWVGLRKPGRLFRHQNILYRNNEMYACLLGCRGYVATHLCHAISLGSWVHEHVPVCSYPCMAINYTIICYHASGQFKHSSLATSQQCNIIQCMYHLSKFIMLIPPSSSFEYIICLAIARKFISE